MSACRRTDRIFRTGFIIFRGRNRASGFTLLELLLAMGLLGVVAAVAYDAVIVGLRATSAAAQREELRQQLAAALDRMARDMAVASDVDEAQDGRFQFDTPAVNDVDYVYDGTDQELSRDDAAGAPRDILRYVTAFDFNYFDSSGTQLSTPVSGSAEDTIRVVQIIATMNRGTETITVATAVYLRNL